MTWLLPEPMLTATVRSPALPARSAAEPKWDGFRAGLSVDDGQVVLRSRRGTHMGPGFPEIVAGTAQLPDATALDGELIVWSADGRLAFEQLQNRLHRRGPSAVQAAAQQPAHFVTGARAGWQVAHGVGFSACQQVRDLCSRLPSAG
ncbi:ATP-dependent DNA ligase [Streptomyces tauricus]|uniref:ATP-dependent DNA ligase n=1 Tax=Streptomyces tauricus TaxID=68274 RepID=UPI00380EFAC2